MYTEGMKLHATISADIKVHCNFLFWLVVAQSTVIVADVKELSYSTISPDWSEVLNRGSYSRP
jgi:hypothetical protein